MSLLITNLLIGIGLSMDAFSLAIVYGTLNLKKRETIILSSIVGMFHFFMPLFGYLLGNYILTKIILSAELLIGIIFAIIGIEMFLSIFKKEEVKALSGIPSLLLFGFTVSIDSFSVGIGVGTLKTPLFLSAIIFSLTSGFFTYAGLTIGNKLNKHFGKISTLIGSIILLGLSLHYLFD